MSIRPSIIRIRPRISRYQHTRSVSARAITSGYATPKAENDVEPRPHIRYLTQRHQATDHFNYHFKIPSDEPNKEGVDRSSNVTTYGETPRMVSIPVDPPGYNIDYTAGAGGGDKFGIRMRSVRLDRLPPRTTGALSGIEISGVETLSLPVFEGPSNSIRLNEFLHKYKPSKTSYLGAGPWIFVKQDNQNPGFPWSKPDNYACEMRGRELMGDVIERIKSFEPRSSIGSNDDYREAQRLSPLIVEKAFQSAAQDLRELALKHNYTAGGWFMQVPKFHVDEVFNALSKSLIGGELKLTAAHTVKASTEGQKSMPAGIHIVSVIVPDAWDKEACKVVLDVLVKTHGLTPVGCKPEMFMQIGYGHFHRTRSGTCTFSPSDFLSKYELTQARYLVLKEKTFTRNAILGNRFMDRPQKEPTTPITSN
ncbi:hypothetical protein TWF730_000370 [Orbilia blumenaviensis]|uniref:Uncharacterized protein n=1 Tax=Orbilia blumenaviensis TaxID=1796055 RepID=A0AAV9VNK7_9PEZI